MTANDPDVLRLEYNSSNNRGSRSYLLSLLLISVVIYYAAFFSQFRVADDATVI